MNMKLCLIVSCFMMTFCMMACTRPAPKHNKGNNEVPYPVKYENELFSVSMPRGWEYDASGWHGLDHPRNEVDLYSDDSPVWIHIVKSFMPIQWKNIDEVTEMAYSLRTLDNPVVKLIDKIDSVDVGGYPASILFFENYVDNDTLIQKQFVTYLEDSHIVMYFNENFHPSYWEVAQELGDRIIRNIKLKKVVNPLDDDEKMKEVMTSSIENKVFGDDVMKKGQEIMEMMK